MDQLRVLVPTPAASNAICRLAEREGLYAKHGLEAEVRVVGDSSALLREARNGGACVFYLAAAAVVEAALDGAELVLFVGAVNRPFHSIVCHPEIASAEDLRGKRVGFIGRNDELSCRLALSQLGLAMGRDVIGVRIVGPPEARLAALDDGSVEATVIAPPYTFRAKKAGFRELVSLADLDQEYQSGSCATSREFVASQRDVVLRFTKALSEAIKLFKTDRDVALAALMAHTGGDPDEAEESWRLFALRCMPEVPALTLSGLRFVMDNVVQHPAVRQHEAEDGQAGERADPPLGEVVPPGRDHRPPFRNLRRRSEPQEAEGRERQDGVADIQGAQDHDRGDRARQNVAEEHAQLARAAQLTARTGDFLSGRGRD